MGVLQYLNALTLKKTAALGPFYAKVTEKSSTWSHTPHQKCTEKTRAFSILFKKREMSFMLVYIHGMPCLLQNSDSE